MKDKLVKLRLKIDGLYHFIESIQPENAPVYTDGGVSYNIKNPSALSIAGTNINTLQLYEAGKCLLLAKAWAGSFLGYLGEKTPYVMDGKRKTIEDIQPTAEVSQTITTLLDNATYIEKVDWAREQIKALSIDIGDDHDYHGEVFGEQIYIKLTEARFFLGFELSRIRDENL